MTRQFSRRKFIFGTVGTAAAAAAARLAAKVSGESLLQGNAPRPHGPHSDAVAGPVGTVDHARNGFHPVELLTDFDYGDRVYEENGRTVREYDLVAFDKEIELVPGVFFPAWTFNGRVPGPTIRCTEGDLLRINFTNAGTHPHTIHFHGIHPAAMDGVPISPNMVNMPRDLTGPGMLQPGESFTYEFDAEPFGCHLYHCHAIPLKRHIHKGLYGMFIIDPKEGRPPANELVMVMNAFDTNFDNANEVYAANTIGFAYMDDPIPVRVGELVRVYLMNIVEFDLINSFHLHATFFDYYDHGTTLEPTLRTVDTIIQAQGQRGILEFRYKHPGMYMFHAHISEFTELGWMGMFHVTEGDETVSHDNHRNHGS
ncbi:MAG: multicopper oxidase domain-containing protein [Chloroflexi bacterium]|nr:multicopper oxidase domain-containing protein [Chloroflexota bacterium]